ncbi:MAG: hypothetical protein LBJ12_00960 [Oscillospiraceae bacterium]|jgi:hypothetical protein|nr:hypothetical protein [Oscillospiraceae bacterium]
MADYKLKLIKGKSYNGLGLKATENSPVVTVMDEAIAKRAVASGYFQLLSEPPQEDDLTRLTEKQLDAYAAENGISLEGLRGEKPKLAAIQEALKALEDEAEDAESTVDFEEGE